jgi:hypothetical protein
LPGRRRSAIGYHRWTFFQQYVVTGQIEPNLTTAVLMDVAANTKEVGSHDTVSDKVLMSALARCGSGRRSGCCLLDYHINHEKGFAGSASTEGTEILLSLVLTTGNIVADVEGADEGNFVGDRVDATSCAR